MASRVHCACSARFQCGVRCQVLSPFGASRALDRELCAGATCDRHSGTAGSRARGKKPHRGWDQQNLPSLHMSKSTCRYSQYYNSFLDTVKPKCPLDSRHRPSSKGHYERGRVSD